MMKVTSGTFQKEFGLYRTQAHKGAVIITNHGGDDLALISAEEYKRLRGLDQQAYYPHELPKKIIDEFGTAPVAEAANQFDDEYQL